MRLLNNDMFPLNSDFIITSPSDSYGYVKPANVQLISTSSIAPPVISHMNIQLLRQLDKTQASEIKKKLKKYV